MRSHASSEHDAAAAVQVASFRFLWRDYEPRCYWWEVLEVARRVFFCAILAVLDAGSKAQVAIGVAVAVCYLALYIHYEPFVFEDDDMVAAVATSVETNHWFRPD